MISVTLASLPSLIPACLGFIVAKCWPFDHKRVAKLIYYVLSPILVLWSVTETPVSKDVIFLPLAVALICSLVSIIVYLAKDRVFKSSSATSLAMMSGSTNAGYFGLPIAAHILGSESFNLYVLTILGLLLHENSTAFFFAARGRYSSSECLWSMARLPTLHGCILGLFFNQWMPDFFSPIQAWKGSIFSAYAFTGMMIVGLGIAKAESFRLNFSFTATALVAKFLIWPLIAVGFVSLGLFSHAFNQSLILVSLMPLAANSVLLATLFDQQTEHVACTVTLSILIALIYTPLMAFWLVA